MYGVIYTIVVSVCKYVYLRLAAACMPLAACLLLLLLCTVVMVMLLLLIAKSVEW
jgi:hypothetical protein